MANPMQTDEEKRRHHRQKILWGADLNIGDPNDKLGVGGYVLACRVTNLSLSGARLQMHLPLQAGTEATLRLSRYGNVPARVSWYRNGFIGLEFLIDQKKFVDMIGADTVERLHLDRAVIPGENDEV